MGSTASGQAPGADDNASGIVVILDALRVFAAARFAPTNTLEFHFYSGEEGGLLGSRDVMNNYASNGVQVLAAVNQDMTGFSPNNVIALYTDYVSAPLTTYLRTIVTAYTSLPWVNDVCGYACGDHASANSAGYPAAYVCDENMADSSPYIHSAADTISTLSFAHILQHAKVRYHPLLRIQVWVADKVDSSRLGSWSRRRISRCEITCIYGGRYLKLSPGERMYIWDRFVRDVFRNNICTWNLRNRWFTSRHSWALD